MSKSKEALGRIRDLPDDELVQAADKARDELFRIKLASYTNQVQDTASIRHKRRELAQILTVMGARSRGAESQAAKGGASEAAAPAAPAKKSTKAPKKSSTTQKEG